MAVALMDRAAGQAKLPETPAVVALFAFGSRLDRDTMQLFARTHSEEVRAAAIASTGQEVLELLHGGLRPQGGAGAVVVAAGKAHGDEHAHQQQYHQHGPHAAGQPPALQALYLFHFFCQGEHLLSGRMLRSGTTGRFCIKSAKRRVQERIATPVCTPRALASRRALARNNRFF